MLWVEGSVAYDKRWRMSRADDDQLSEAALLGKALASLRDSKNMTQGAAAEAYGIRSDKGWGKYERGLVPSIEQRAVQQRLVEAVGATIDDLMREKAIILARGDNDDEPTPPAGGAAMRPRLVSGTDFAPRWVPVYGLAAAAGERIAIANGAEIRYVPMHPAQYGYKRVGAAEIVGESMYPRWKPREIAYFVFDMVPPRNDDVIVELLDGTALIKEYIGRTNLAIKVREYYPQERDFEVKLADIKALHAIVG